MRQEYSTTGARKQEAQCLQGLFSNRFIGEWTYIQGLAAGRCRGSDAPLPHAGVLEKRKRKEGKGLIVPGKTKPDEAAAENRVAGVAYERTHVVIPFKARSIATCEVGCQVRELALSGMAQGLAGLFLEAHSNPEAAQCDGPCALPLDLLEPFLRQMQQLDKLAKSLEPLNTNCAASTSG